MSVKRDVEDPSGGIARPGRGMKIWPPVRTRRSQRFLSLRWKLLFSLLLLTLTLSTLSAQFFHRYLLNRYDESRRVKLASYSHQVNGLVRQQRQYLEQVAVSLPVLSRIRRPLAKHDLDALRDRFDEFWPAFQLDMGLEDARYLDVEGHDVLRWGSVSRNEDAADSPAWLEALHKSLNQESAVSLINCAASCRIQALVPVLVGGRVVGLFAVGMSLADTVLTFHNTAAADIAVLADVSRPSSDPADVFRANWGVRVEAASNAANSLPVLKHIAAHAPLEGLINGQRTEIDGRTYEAARLHLAPDNQSKGIHLVVLEDISTELAEAKDTARRALLMTLAAGLLSLALLYFLLGHSLKRLLQTVAAIPLLGQGAFAQLRQSVKLRRNRGFHDEIDVLNHTAFSLSQRLEALEKDVDERTRSLHEALRQICQERAFASSLLEHAEVIIVTCDRAGRILTVNRYGKALAGYDEETLLGMTLIGSPLLQPDHDDLQFRYLNLLDTHQKHLRHEAALVCADGQQREISWIHTRLEGQEKGESALLSVGLDITERKRNEAKMAFLADHDPLTGCFNRRRFHLELERMLDTATRYGLRGALLYLDLDRFKYVNDTSGHQAGDNLLLLVTDELRKVLRASDLIGRLGGDEFAIAMLDADEGGAIATAERINQRLAGIALPGEDISRRVSASIGIALFPDIGASSGNDLLVNADLAMYQAKDNGRVGWHVFSPQERAKERLREWMTWEEQIKRGMAEDRFELFFQPVMRISDSDVSRYEVLLRLRMEDGRLASPGQFLEIAERSGLIRDLDRWVVRAALQRLAGLAPEHANVSLSVNLSALSIADGKLLDDFATFFSDTGADPRQVVFEITETAAVADFSQARQFVNEIKALGSSFALDDFGSGFASFYYLKQFPVDFVKIDGAFIRNLPDSVDDQIFVRAMVDIARAYGKQTVAEFVENDAILQMLEEYGVDYAQGYHIGMPSATWLSNNETPALN